MTKRTFDFISALFGLLLSAPRGHDCDMAGGSPFTVLHRSVVCRRRNLPHGQISFHGCERGQNGWDVDLRCRSPHYTSRILCFRKWKLDELIQLWNVLKGDMSLVGPRPQVQSDAALYTEAEKRMLSILPGITDPASIVFSDEGEILKAATILTCSIIK